MKSMTVFLQYLPCYLHLLFRRPPDSYLFACLDVANINSFLFMRQPPILDHAVQITFADNDIPILDTLQYVEFIKLDT